MRRPFPYSAAPWLLVAALVLGLSGWNIASRIARLERVAELTRSEAVVQPESETGYAGGVRERVRVEATGRTTEAIAQAQHLLATGTWRVRRIEAENFPQGRDTHAALPARGWLAAVAEADHFLTGTPRGIAVERALLFAAPLAQLLLLLVITAAALSVAGLRGAALVGAGAMLLQPWARFFLPGADPEPALQAVLALGSVFPLWRGLAAEPSRFNEQAGFILAGICGGAGFWVAPAGQMPLLAGIFFGGLLAAFRGGLAGRPSLPWRMWALAGAGTILAVYLLEGFAWGSVGMELRAVHPLYGVCWLGCGEILQRCWHRSPTRAGLWPMGGGVLAMLALPAVMLMEHKPGFLATDPLNLRLLGEPDAVVHFPSWLWLQFEGFSLSAVAVMLPLLIFVAAAWAVFSGRLRPADNRGLFLLLGVLLPLLAVAAFRSGGAVLLGAVLLLLVLALAAGPFPRGIHAGLYLLLLLPGAWGLRPGPELAGNALTRAEALAVVERDLAHWLAKRSTALTPPVVHAPPGLTASLIHYGGLRGVGTLSWENPEGLAFLVRTAVSVSPEETHALLRARGVNYVILPSWDGFFEGPLQAAAVQGGQMFHEGLARWSLPPWLRAVPYRPSALPGFDPVHVAVFEVVEEQEPPLAAARLAGYFVEMEDWSRAERAEQVLLKYPHDFAALLARVQYHAARRDADRFVPLFAQLLGRLEAGGDRYLPWERRVCLAIALAQGNRLDLAEKQMRRCVQEVSAERLRTLTPGTLLQWFALGQALGIEPVEPALLGLARNLSTIPLPGVK